MLQVFLFRLSDVSQHLALLFVSTEDFVLQTSSAMLLAQLWDTECFSSEADMINKALESIQTTLYIQQRHVWLYSS